MSLRTAHSSFLASKPWWSLLKCSNQLTLWIPTDINLWKIILLKHKIHCDICSLISHEEMTSKTFGPMAGKCNGKLGPTKLYVQESPWSTMTTSSIKLHFTTVRSTHKYVVLRKRTLRNTWTKQIKCREGVALRAIDPPIEQVAQLTDS